MGPQNHDDIGDVEDVMGDEVYQPAGPDSREDEGILDPEDTLNGLGSDPYDTGWSPPEQPLGVEHQGTTAREQREGETLDQRLAEERPDPSLEELDADIDLGDDLGDDVSDVPGGEVEPLDDEVGAERAGRLVAPDQAAHDDAEKDMFAEDVGVDGGAASAEKAAVRLIPDPGDESL
jgi:hypothetical protein